MHCNCLAQKKEKTMIVKSINAIYDEIGRNPADFELIDFKINFVNQKHPFVLFKEAYKNLVKYEIKTKHWAQKTIFLLYGRYV